MKKTSHSDYQKDYQKNYRAQNQEKAREYRQENKEKAKAYQYSYRNDPLLRGIKKDQEVLQKSRFYICKLGEERLKIGATYVDSNRIYHLKWTASLLGYDLSPLYFFDCENRDVIQLIEKKVKELYCDSNLGLNRHSFKNEVSNFVNLKDIKNFVQETLENSGYSYDFKKL